MNVISTSSPRVGDLRCDYQLNPLGIESKEPGLSWQLASDQRGAAQSAYQIQVRDRQGDLWDTGKVPSDQSLHIPYRGPALRSRQRCTWQVRVWDCDDRPSDWSEPAWWEMGLLQRVDWQAQWIEPDWDEDPTAFNPCPYLRATFTLRTQPVSARLYVTAHGLYEASLNGQRVGDAYFTPGYSSYHHRLPYQTYDVSDQLHAGENVTGVILGDGWYRGSLGITSQRNTYGQRLGLLWQLTEQEPDGKVPLIIPSVAGAESSLPRTVTLLNGSAGWGDAAVILPWTLYQVYGDQRILEEQYASMKAWVNYQRRQAQDKYQPQGHTTPRYQERKPLEYELYLWDTSYHWGEWLEPDDPVPGLLFGELTPEVAQILSAPHIATAYFAYSTHLLAETARVLGNEEDARRYSEIFSKIWQAFLTEFVGEHGEMTPDKQSSYVRALAFNLLPEHLRSAATERLVALIQEAGTHLGTGFLSTPYLCPVLGENGHLELAYALLMQDTPPSWLYAVKKGATTIWENWDGIDEEGNPHNSLNHYSYGAIGNWLYQAVAGIAPGTPGYRHIIFQPQPGGGLTFASATYQSLYGEIATNWQMDGERFHLSATVPTNTTATVVIPTRLGREITGGEVTLSSAVGVREVRYEQEATFIEIGSGMYAFTVISHG